MKKAAENFLAILCLFLVANCAGGSESPGTVSTAAPEEATEDSAGATPARATNNSLPPEEPVIIVIDKTAKKNSSPPSAPEPASLPIRIPSLATPPARPGSIPRVPPAPLVSPHEITLGEWKPGGGSSSGGIVTEHILGASGRVTGTRTLYAFDRYAMVDYLEFESGERWTPDTRPSSGSDWKSIFDGIMMEEVQGPWFYTQVEFPAPKKTPRKIRRLEGRFSLWFSKPERKAAFFPAGSTAELATGPLHLALGNIVRAEKPRYFRGEDANLIVTARARQGRPFWTTRLFYDWFVILTDGTEWKGRDFSKEQDGEASFEVGCLLPDGAPPVKGIRVEWLEETGPREEYRFSAQNITLPEKL